MDSHLASTAHLTPAEGLLARLRLAEQGIESRLESFELVTWLWHLSVALHGVKLVVRSDDAERADAILGGEPLESAESHTTRRCAQCDESLPGDWFVCWRCGTDADAQRDESFFVETIRTPRILKVIENIEYLGPWLIVAAALVLFVPAIAFPFLLLCFVYLFRDAPEATNVVFTPEESAATPAADTPSDLAVETNRRALASAMFGLVWFPPLTLYSIWILLNHDDETGDTKIRLWRRAAWTFNFVGLWVAMSFIKVFVTSLDDGYLSWWMSQLFDTYLEISQGVAR